MKKDLKREIAGYQKKRKKSKSNRGWIVKIIFFAFVISFCFSFLSEMTIPNVPLYVGVIVLFVVIGLGVLFDMIGVAITTADEAPFHSMSARKIRGANVAVQLKKNADKVSSFCNDVIGDICGIISGSAGVVIAKTIASYVPISSFIITLFVTAIIAAFTIGGKAMGKSVAINKNNMILYEFSKLLSYLYHPKNK